MQDMVRGGAGSADKLPRAALATSAIQALKETPLKQTAAAAAVAKVVANLPGAAGLAAGASPSRGLALCRVDFGSRSVILDSANPTMSLRVRALLLAAGPPRRPLRRESLIHPCINACLRGGRLGGARTPQRNSVHASAVNTGLRLVVPSVNLPHACIGTPADWSVAEVGRAGVSRQPLGGA